MMEYKEGDIFKDLSDPVDYDSMFPGIEWGSKCVFRSDLTEEALDYLFEIEKDFKFWQSLEGSSVLVEILEEDEGIEEDQLYTVKFIKSGRIIHDIPGEYLYPITFENHKKWR